MKEVLSAGFLSCLGIFYLLYSWQYESGTLAGPGPGFFPRILAIILIGSNLWLLLRALLRRKEGTRLRTLLEGTDARGILTAGAVVAAIILYLLILPAAGFLLASPLLVLFLARVMGGKSWIGNLLLAVISSACTYWLFWIIMRVPIPMGLLEGR